MDENKELKEELNIYKERLETAMAAGNLAWWEMELPSGEVKFNDRKAEMLGYSPDEFNHYSDFTDLIHPEDKDRAMKAMRDHLEGRAERYEVEYRIKKKDGDYICFRDVGRITEEGEDYKKVSGIVIDIDERKQVEERVDFLHSLLRHDLGNKLQVIRGYIDLLEDYDLPEEVEEYLSLSLNGVESGMDIIEKVRTLRKAQDKEDIGEIDVILPLEKAVEEVKDLAEDENIEIFVECEKEHCKVKGGSLLNRVFSNILENSVQHSDGSEIHIKGGSEGEKVQCIIEDDGKGIPDEEKEKIWDRGYTTDEDGGTGLGMFLVKTLVNTYGGSIELEDSDLGGAKFVIKFEKA